MRVRGCLGAEAERDQPGDERVEDGAMEDVEDEIEGEGLDPGGWFAGHKVRCELVTDSITLYLEAGGEEYPSDAEKR